MKLGDKVTVDAVASIEIGWVQTDEGKNILLIKPIPRSGGNKMLPFGLELLGAQSLERELHRMLEEVEASRRPN